ncbi:MAG: monovalent cation/H+ antiporter subunit D family protein [Candidatus Omnitrophica bacterium]|nr:monovalent cation/H+ antiporter subunit D family protein [Candidatus Omnitrophota bacterium]
MTFIPLFVVLPLLGAFIISFVGKYKKCFSDIFTNIITLTLAFLSFYSIFLLNTKSSLYIYKVGGWAPPFGISLVLDGLSVFMLVTVNILAFLITLFCINYMEKFTSKFRFYTLFLLMLAGMNGIIITADIFNLFVFLEIASVASYALVAYGIESEELEASFKYMMMGSLASLFILLSIAFLYSYASTLNMADLAQVLKEKGVNKVVTFAFVLFLVGFGLKAAIVPFHAWLPDAHPSAPAPISAALSGVLIKVLGIYSLIRISTIIGINKLFSNTLMFLGGLSIIVGVLLAIGQMDLKRLLAYHSISQVGYIILGLGIGTPLGVSGGLFHLFNHSIFKSLLFLNSGAIEYTIGTRNLDQMGGLREKMPITSATCLIASMSISGIPPFNGFFSKLLIVLACIKSGYIGYGIVAVIGSILTLSSFMKVQRYAFFGSLSKKSQEAKEVPSFMKLAMLILAIICSVGGLLIFKDIGNYFIKPAQEIIVK